MTLGTSKKAIILKVRKLIQEKNNLLFVVFCGGFTLLKLLSINTGPRVSDENWYFYAGHLISKGILPYRDFFIAHLPSQALFYGLIIKLIGFNLLFFKLMILLITLMTALLLFLLIPGKQGKRVGLYSAVIFLFSFTMLVTTDFAVGVHEASFFLILSWFLFFRSAKLSGLSFFVGLTFRRYIFPAGLAFVIYRMIKKDFRELANFLIFSAVPYLFINLVLYLKFGKVFFDFAWNYNFLKNIDSQKFPLYSDFMINNIFIIIFAFASAVLLFSGLRRRWGGKKFKYLKNQIYFDFGMTAVITLTLQYIFFLYFSNVFWIYLVSVMPFLSLLASYALTVFLPIRSKRVAMPLILALSILNAYLFQSNIARGYRIDHFQEIVADIKAASSKEDSIFGSYLVTPIIALSANRSITANQVDTNFQRVLTGSLTKEAATRYATSSGLFIQLADDPGKEGSFVGHNPGYIDQEVIEDNCELVNQYPTRWQKKRRLIIWRCNL
jgi:hypothetical protein